MFTQFFGNFLLNNQYVTKEQLVEALQEKKNSHLQLGVLAINAGYMNSSQVEQVHIMQTKIDKRIGELAIDAGFITAEQVDGLLSTQQPGYLLLGQTLVDKGYLTNASFEKAINEYKNEYSLTDKEIVNAAESKITSMITNLCAFDASQSSKFFINYVSLLINNLVRFIGDDFTLLNPIKGIIDVSDDYITNQNINGAFSTNTYIYMNASSMKSFATRYSDEEITDVDQYTQSIIGDFINLHNGLYAVNMSNEQGIELALTPPIFELPEQKTSANVFVLPVSYPFGIVNFAFTM